MENKKSQAWFIIASNVIYTHNKKHLSSKQLSCLTDVYRKHSSCRELLVWSIWKIKTKEVKSSNTLEGNVALVALWKHKKYLCWNEFENCILLKFPLFQFYRVTLAKQLSCQCEILIKIEPVWVLLVSRIFLKILLSMMENLTFFDAMDKGWKSCCESFRV